MTNLLKKQRFKWTEEATEAFSKLKHILMSASVLVYPDFQSPFTVETDACDVGVGTILLQKEHPVAFYSKKLSDLWQRASTYSKTLGDHGRRAEVVALPAGEHFHDQDRSPQFEESAEPGHPDTGTTVFLIKTGTRKPIQFSTSGDERTLRLMLCLGFRRKRAKLALISFCYWHVSRFQIGWRN